jgi:hypothetical protein
MSVLSAFMFRNTPERLAPPSRSSDNKVSKSTGAKNPRRESDGCQAATAIVAMPSPQYEYPDPTTLDKKNAFRTKLPSQFYDPCSEASANSMKCLDQNNYEKSKCREAFDAYKECKRLWVHDPDGYRDTN